MRTSSIRAQLTVWTILLSVSLSAQQVLNVAGAQSEAAGITLAYSIGELLIRQPASGSITLTEGVIQPIGTLPTAIVEPAFRQKIEVFPNPAIGYVHIRTSDQHSVDYSLVSGSGQVILNGKLPGGSGVVSIRHLPVGWYVLHTKGPDRSYGPVKIMLRPEH